MKRRFLVAVVDDEEPVRRALRRLLMAAGLDVETFADGYEFLEFVKTQLPDCVVLDLRLPGLTGLDVQEQLTRARVPIPSVIVSGHDEPGIAERALAAGASAYLEKPLDESRLLAAVGAAALAGSQARQRVN